MYRSVPVRPRPSPAASPQAPQAKPQQLPRQAAARKTPAHIGPEPNLKRLTHSQSCSSSHSLSHVKASSAEQRRQTRGERGVRFKSFGASK
jgi:hypothetical protein